MYCVDLDSNSTTPCPSTSQDGSLLAGKKTEMEERQGVCEALQQRSQAAEEAVQRSRQHYQAVTAGLSSGSDGQDETLAAQKIGGLHGI